MPKRSVPTPPQPNDPRSGKPKPSDRDTERPRSTGKRSGSKNREPATTNPASAGFDAATDDAEMPAQRGAMGQGETRREAAAEAARRRDGSPQAAHRTDGPRRKTRSKNRSPESSQHESDKRGDGRLSAVVIDGGGFPLGRAADVARLIDSALVIDDAGAAAALTAAGVAVRSSSAHERDALATAHGGNAPLIISGAGRKARKRLKRNLLGAADHADGHPGSPGTAFLALRDRANPDGAVGLITATSHTTAWAASLASGLADRWGAVLQPLTGRDPERTALRKARKMRALVMGIMNVPGRAALLGGLPDHGSSEGAPTVMDLIESADTDMVIVWDDPRTAPPMPAVQHFASTG